MKPLPDSESVTFGSETTMTARVAAGVLGVCEKQVLTFARQGLVRAIHTAVPGKSAKRLRWLIETSSVEELAAARAARPAAKNPSGQRPSPDPKVLVGTLSTKEVAAQLGTRDDTIYRYCRQGVLRASVVTVPAWHGKKKVIRVEESSVAEFVARRSVSRPPPKPRPKKLRPILPSPWEGTATLSVAEAAAKLSRAKSHVYTLCRQGRLKTQRFLSSAWAKKQITVRVTTASVEAFVGGRRNEDALLPAVEPPPGCLPLQAVAGLSGQSVTCLLKLFRSRFIKGVKDSAGKVFINLDSVNRHRAATGSRNFWTPARVRRYNAGSAPASKRTTG